MLCPKKNRQETLVNKDFLAVDKEGSLAKEMVE